MSARQPGDDPPDRSRILLVDDEPRIRDFVGRALGSAGFRVEFAATGQEGLELTGQGDYDLVILDLVMPDVDGRLVLERLMRTRPEQPVLVLSCLADVSSKVDCLDLGAQDYLTKPFSLAELLARVRARLRAEVHAPRPGWRQDASRPAGPEHPPIEMLRVGDLTLDTVRLRADYGNGTVALTRLEFLLLRELMEHAGRLVPKGQLLRTVWGYAFDPGSNVVDVCVRRLRRKLGFELITTVRGEGYQLAAR
jgi:DNA-binding response OmpR family regulator